MEGRNRIMALLLLIHATEESILFLIVSFST
jgi:hypothetical protein